MITISSLQRFEDSRNRLPAIPGKIYQVMVIVPELGVKDVRRLKIVSCNYKTVTATDVFGTLLQYDLETWHQMRPQTVAEEPEVAKNREVESIA